MNSDDRDVLEALIVKGDTNGTLSYVEQLIHEERSQSEGALSPWAIVVILSIATCGAISVVLLLMSMLVWIFSGDTLF